MRDNLFGLLHVVRGKGEWNLRTLEYADMFLIFGKYTDLGIIVRRVSVLPPNLSTASPKNRSELPEIRHRNFSLRMSSTTLTLSAPKAQTNGPRGQA